MIPHAGESPAVYLHVALTEAAAFHAKTLESRPDDYTPTVRVRLEAGRYVLAEDYCARCAAATCCAPRCRRRSSGRDGLLLPALAVPATPFGAATVRVGGVDEPVRNVTLRLTQLFNLTGHAGDHGAVRRHRPAGLPIGAQLVGTATAALLAAGRDARTVVRGGRAPSS